MIEHFVDEHLSNWYVRLCRRRFWKGEYEADKISAYQTLYECLETILRLIAPVSPFFSDAIFNELNKEVLIDCVVITDGVNKICYLDDAENPLIVKIESETFNLILTKFQ